jgi:hypothetical protein
MYPKTLIKALVPKTQGLRVQIISKVSSIFDNRICAQQRSHEQRRTIRLLAHWLKKTSDKKETLQKSKGLKKTSDEKRGTKNASGLKKTSDEKIGTPKIQRAEKDIR